MPAPEWPFIDTPEEFGSPDAAPADAQARSPANGSPFAPPAPVPASQVDAKAKLDAIYADKAHPFHRGDLTACDEVLNLTRASLGSAGRAVGFQVGMNAPDTTSPVGDGVTSEPPPPETPAETQSEASILGGMVADSLVSAAPVLGERLGVSIDPQQVREIVGTLQPRPDGFPMRIEDELQHHPADVRNELEELHTLGWDALRRTHGFPLSAQAEDDRHGYRFAPRAFAFLVELGAQIRDQQEAEQLRLNETRPGDARTNDPGQRRSRWMR